MILYKRTIDSLTEQELDCCVALMRHQRRAQVAKMGNLQVRRRTILGEWMAKTSISEHTGIPIEQIVLNRDAHGKPYVVGPNLHFNVSHSGDLVVCALHDRPIGIDVEQIREINMRLADRLCTPADAAWLAEDFSPRRLLSLCSQILPGITASYHNPPHPLAVYPAPTRKAVVQPLPFHPRRAHIIGSTANLISSNHVNHPLLLSYAARGVRFPIKWDGRPAQN